jgi:hypothetical protein
MMDAFEHFILLGGRVLITTLVLAALFGATAQFVSSAGGIFGLVHYFINFGYTYGYETLERYGPSFNF